VNLLLDTHVFLWWDRRDQALSAGARVAIEDPSNDVFISAASVWEIAIKRRLGKVTFHGSASSAIGANGFHELPIDAEDAGKLAWRHNDPFAMPACPHPRHRSAVHETRWRHNDPFDRLLVAQAMRLGLVLLTADRSIRSCNGVALLPAG
jgi:PIN domain nuclease of toxin-antitoxin system